MAKINKVGRKYKLIKQEGQGTLKLGYNKPKVKAETRRKT